MLRDWIARVWFFGEYVEKPNKLGKMSFHSQPDDGTRRKWENK